MGHVSESSKKMENKICWILTSVLPYTTVDYYVNYASIYGKKKLYGLEQS